MPDLQRAVASQGKVMKTLRVILRNIFSPEKGHQTEASSQASRPPVNINPDNPITREDEDTLGRAKLAHSFADQICALNPADGFVVGVMGPWGSGKTSFVNLTAKHLVTVGTTVLELNPWMFSGADQLVKTFFIELSAQLKLRPDLAEIGKRVEDYGETFSGLGWVPVVGPWIDRLRIAFRIVGALLRRRKISIDEGRDKVRKALTALSKPIVIVVDDIDRLTTSEIRDIFKLVRVTASFPKVIYLLAFDRERIEKALDEQGVPGRNYLEKIVQIGYDLPAVPDRVLISQVSLAIDSALAHVDEAGPFDSGLWPDVLMEIIRPLIRNMRDIRRYAAAVFGTVSGVGKQVALVDVLALEAVRVFLPDVFRQMHHAVSGLTSTARDYGNPEAESHLRQEVEELVRVAGQHGEVVRDLVRRLFPAGSRHLGGTLYGSDLQKRWLRERRVAHEVVLSFYLERVVGEQLQAFSDAENAWFKMADQSAFSAYLETLPVDRLEDVISSLEAYEDEFTLEHVVPATVVLLNLLPCLPERQRGMFDLGTRLIVGRVVFRLIRTPKEPLAIEAAVRKILPQVASLASRRELIEDVGYREGAGHKLVSEEAAKDLERTWRAAVRAASPHQLANETDLLRTLIFAKEQAEPDEPSFAIPDSVDVTRALLKSARADIRSQSMDSRAVRLKPRLAWDALIKLYGDEATLRERIDALKASNPNDLDALLELAEKYLDGWRPKEFDDD